MLIVNFGQQKLSHQISISQKDQPRIRTIFITTCWIQRVALISVIMIRLHLGYLAKICPNCDVVLQTFVFG